MAAIQITVTSWHPYPTFEWLWRRPGIAEEHQVQDPVDGYPPYLRATTENDGISSGQGFDNIYILDDVTTDEEGFVWCRVHNPDSAPEFT